VLAGTRLNLLIYLTLILATFAVYAQVINFDFVNYDDALYTTENLNVRQGLTTQGLQWALTSRLTGNWHPLTWVSHMLDCQLFGLDSGWHHLHNVLLHALAAVMLCIFLQRATGTRWRSALAALLFALHPLHVESVAWVAERKDVLSACFWFLTLWLYVRYTERPGTGRYLAVVLGFCLGLMAKPMVVTLPLVLLLLDYWPLARFGRKAIWEKLPLLGLSGAASAIAYLAQKYAGAVNDAVKALPLEARLANATHSYSLYILKTLWPARLAVFYPYPRDFAFLPLLAEGFVLAAVTAGVIVLRRRAPYLLMGWGWFVVTLVPVIGLVQVGGQAHADRYMYIPMVGLLVMMIWGAAEVLEKLRAKRLAIPLAAAACLASAVLCWIQVRYWRDSETLFRHALAVTNDNSVANHNLGSYLMASPGRLSEALPYLENAVRINPDSAPAQTDLGSALGMMGRLPDAIAQLQIAVQLAPDAPRPHISLGTALAYAGRLPEAAAEFESALRIDPNDAAVQSNLGLALSGIPGRLPDALRHLEEADRLRPDPELEQTIAHLRAQQQ
jgi:tetratricopeptide (TPR) repeat protein